ncbi:murein biosynthesis integral membrane protein MurJ [Kribbella sp. CA-247076]|uniref:murein biosynthesis integral membrane protein MurJ n=1 Tax=Kribbella sp. CA-247076 TaxID=3239941 RepID=UPI003D9378F7
MWSVTRAAAVVTVLTAGSTLLGFGRDVVIAATFGAGAALDAYFVAQGLMNVVLGLIAGAMAKAAVPVTAREAGSEDGRCQQHRGFNVALSVTLIVLGLGSLVMWIAVTPVVAALAPGFAGAQAHLAQQLTRVVLVATVLIAGTNLLAGLVQAHGRFGWSGLQGVPFNLVMIAAAVLFGPQYGVIALAWGFVAGSATRLLLQLIPTHQLGTRISFSLRLDDPAFREIARLVPALLVGSAIGNVNTLVDRAVGSTLAEGTISALGYAWRLVSLGETLLIASLLTALYPALGAYATDRARMRGLVDRGVAVTAVSLTPICVILACAAEPLVFTVFGHGGFSDADAAVTAKAMVFYAPALLALGWRELVVRASYAVGDSSRPVGVAVAAMVVNVVGDLTLGLRYGITGLAASTTLSLVLAAGANTWLLRRRHRAISLRPAVTLLLRSAILATAAACAGLVTRALVPFDPTAGVLHAFAEAACIAAAVLVVYAAGLLITKAPEGGLLLRALNDARPGRIRQPS